MSPAELMEHLIFRYSINTTVSTIKTHGSDGDGGGPSRGGASDDDSTGGGTSVGGEAGKEALAAEFLRWKNTVQRHIRTRVLYLIELWMQRHFRDFEDPQAMWLLTQFISEVPSCVCVMA